MKKFLVVCLLGLLLCTQVHADLIISEVYFDSTDEWVEVYNAGPDNYSGNIVLSGAKASTVNIPNINISPHQAVIVGDSMSMVTNTGIVAKSGLSLNFPDTQPINVRIISGSDAISSFSVDTGTMATAKLTNASIHKNLADNNNYIAQEPYIANSTVGHPSNPGVVYDSFVGINPPDLIVSEVYFEGADERFEITNKGSQDFTGEITVQGLSNLPLVMSISINAQASIVIADTSSSFIDASMVSVAPENLVIPDDGNIQATLSFQSELIDTFDVAEDLVAPYIDGHNSFEKVRYNNQLQITVATGDRISNVPNGIIANPGTVFTVYDQVVDIGQTDGGGDVGEPPSYCASLGSEIQVSEIFFGSGDYAPYIELYVPSAFDQNITLSGSLINNPLTISVTEEAGDYFLVSADTTAYIDTNSLHDNQELSFRGELGYISIYGQNGQVLDIVDIRTFGDKNGVIFSSIGDCQRIFQDTNTMSPGFDHALLYYKPTQTIIHGGGGGGSCPSTDGNEPHEDAPPTNSGIDITDIVYDPFGSDTNREVITLRSLFTTDFDLKQARMTVSTRSGTQSLSGILYAGQIQSFTGNFRFPNTSACVSLLTGTHIFDVYCYPTTQSGAISNTGNIQMTGVAMPLFTGYFDITDVVYDPVGNDTNRETISFTTSGIAIDAGTNLIIGSRKFSLKNYIGYYSGGTTLTGNFRFPNSSPTCVSWAQGTNIIDTYCYNPFVHDTRTTISLPNVRIRSIVYDPPGSDTDKEQISLELLSPSSIDLSTLKLRIGTRNVAIHGILTTGSIQSFTGNFRFPNHDACVSLMSDDTILDTLCYLADGEDDNLNSFVDYTDISIDIVDVVYDPPGSDTNHEELHLLSSGGPINLADDFYLTINGTKRYLSSFGIIEGDDTLVGNFRFPNSKETCISIQREDRVFDTYCYTPQEEIDTTGEQADISPDYGIRIISLVPNPIGKDQDAESVTLLLSGSLPIDLSQGFNLRINKTKRKITGILLPGQEQTIVGNFRFPNSASCVSIEKNNTIFDTFCYEKPQEGDTFTINQSILKQISTLDLSILQKSELTRFGNKLCITYEDATIKCKNAPLKVNASNELKLYKSYISVLHDYLMGDWNILFYNSPLTLYKTIFDTAKQDLKEFKSFVVIHDTRVPVYDIPQRFALQYQQAFIDSFADSVLSHILGDKGQAQLSIFRDQRFASLDKT